MQFLSRPATAPGILRASEAEQSRYRLREYWELDPARRSQSSVPAIGLAADNRDLVEALAAMSFGKCAFCEARSDHLRAHRFRPPGNALPRLNSKDPHLYYLWLTDAWQNLYPSCEECRPKEPQFPLSSSRVSLPTLDEINEYVLRSDGVWPAGIKERRLLLDPAEDNDFERHLVPTLDGELVGLSRKGASTIIVFELNRNQLRHERAMAYAHNFDELRKLASGLNPETFISFEQLFNFSYQEFGGTWYLVLRRLARQIRGALGTSWQTSRAQILSFYLKLIETRDGYREIEQALSALSLEDTTLATSSFSGLPTFALRASIRSVEMTDFKAIENLKLTLQEDSWAKDRTALRQAPSLVILGENATGKSSVLEAIALTLASNQARNALRLSWSDFALDPTQLGAERPSSKRQARVEVQMSNGQFASLRIENGSSTVSNDFGDLQVPVFAYGAFRRFVKSTRRPVPHRHIRNLFDGSTLSNPEPWLKSLSQGDFEMVIRTLRDLLSIDGDFDVIQRERGSRRLRVVTSLVEPDGQTRYSRAPLQAVSSGYRSMLAMLCDVLRGLHDRKVNGDFEDFRSAHGIVLIDEIEAHLHPRWKVQVMTSLRDALPNVTFIVTTHDPLCLRGMGDGEVIVLHRVATVDSNRQSSMPIIVEQLDGLPSVADLRIEQLLTSDFFQLLSTDDAAADRRMAKIADLIAARARGDVLSDAEQATLREFENDISSAIPVGSTEVHRLVQQAVAEFLRRRRDASSRTLANLREQAKAEILTALAAI